MRATHVDVYLDAVADLGSTPSASMRLKASREDPFALTSRCG